MSTFRVNVFGASGPSQYIGKRHVEFKLFLYGDGTDDRIIIDRIAECRGPVETEAMLNSCGKVRFDDDAENTPFPRIPQQTRVEVDTAELSVVA